MREIQEIADKLKAADPAFDATVRCFFTREPFEVLPDERIVRAVDPRDGSSAGTQSGALRRYALDGCGAAFGGKAPRPSSLTAGRWRACGEEWVDIESVAQLAEILVRAALDYCQ